tara:strand:- start:86 stop:727 length:642 start_codon:yes stop_codon:yes gene_type:complete
MNNRIILALTVCLVLTGYSTSDKFRLKVYSQTKIINNRADNCLSTDMYYKVYSEKKKGENDYKEKALLSAVGELIKTIKTEISVNQVKHLKEDENSGRMQQAYKQTTDAGSNYYFGEVEIKSSGQRIQEYDDGKMTSLFYNTTTIVYNDQTVEYLRNRTNTQLSDTIFPNINKDWYRDVIKELELNGCEFNIEEYDNIYSICLFLKKDLIHQK